MNLPQASWNVRIKKKMEPCKSETKSHSRKTRADTKKQLNHKWIITLEHHAIVMHQQNPWTSWNMRIKLNIILIQTMKRLYTTVTNRPHTLNDSYYDSDSPEEEPRKEKIQHTAFVCSIHQNDNRSYIDWIKLQP